MHFLPPAIHGYRVIHSMPHRLQTDATPAPSSPPLEPTVMPALAAAAQIRWLRSETEQRRIEMGLFGAAALV
jgi:hypothetical protein